MNYFSQNLKFLLKRYDTSQEQLALYIEKHQSSISYWINEVGVPDINILIKIHEYFGISLDALVLKDLRNGKIVTDEHVKDFKRIGKINRQVLGKVNSVSKEYFVDDDGLKNIVSEPDPVAIYAITSQFSHISQKLDQLRLLSEEILKKGSK